MKIKQITINGSEIYNKNIKGRYLSIDMNKLEKLKGDIIEKKFSNNDFQAEVKSLLAKNNIKDVPRDILEDYKTWLSNDSYKKDAVNHMKDLIDLILTDEDKKLVSVDNIVTKELNDILSKEKNVVDIKLSVSTVNSSGLNTSPEVYDRFLIKNNLVHTYTLILGDK